MRERFNRRVFLYALAAADSDFAIDVFVSNESAKNALREVLFDEPGFAPLLTIVPLPPPWLDDADRAFEPAVSESMDVQRGDIVLAIQPRRVSAAEGGRMSGRRPQGETRRPLPRPGETRR